MHLARARTAKGAAKALFGRGPPDEVQNPFLVRVAANSFLEVVVGKFWGLLPSVAMAPVLNSGDIRWGVFLEDPPKAGLEYHSRQDGLQC